MLQPTVFEKIKRDDYSVLPFEANKFYAIQAGSLESLGYSYKTSFYYKNSLEISSSKNFVKTAATSSDGSYNYINWRSIDHMYYRTPNDPSVSFEGHIEDITEKNLYLTASSISSPYFDMGEGFKKGTVYVTGSLLRLQDDSNNNLYDANIDVSTLADSNYLDAYFGFQNMYPCTRFGFGSRVSKTFSFQSRTISNPTNFRTKNVTISEGLLINNTGSGAQITFDGPSYIEIPHHEELSYELFEDFSLSFWINSPVSQSVTSSIENSIITKRSYTSLQEISEVDSLLDSDSTAKRTIISSSLKYIPSDYYPYDVSIYNQSAGSDAGKIIFRRSDGGEILTLTGSSAINDGNYHHICVTKNNSLLYLYVDGQLETSGSEVSRQPTNGHTILFGAEDYQGKQQFSGSLDEVRFYSYAATPQQISGSLSNNSNILAYQTRNVGNVFYRRGEVVLTTPLHFYHRELQKRNWELQYRNRYTIYEYETLIRISRGNFNKTMNPTSKQSPKSNLYLNDFTGSLSPYATTVGLYNKDYQLVAVGKLGRPLKMRDDVDINIIVRWDY